MKTYKLTKGLSTSSLSTIGGQTIDKFCRKILLQKLQKIKIGRIEIKESGNTFVFGDQHASKDLSATMIVLHPRAYSRIALGGSIGAGESYRDKDWDTTSEANALTNLIRLFVLNRETLEDIDNGFGSLLSPVQKYLHRMRRNSVEGARKNIKAHYDIGNNFFELFLDSTWMYSSGIFNSPDATLEEASTEKIDRICRMLNLGPEHHVLEIGTGWGGFAIHAAKYYGCRITTTTISDEQYKFAGERIKLEGLTEKINLLCEDYRNLTGTFDKIVSIEMIESVGLDHIDTYFKKCQSLLREDGEMMIQSITIQDQFYEYARKNVDFIQTHIFPGGGLPSIGSLSLSIAKNSQLRICNLDDFGLHYARTLNQWSQNLKKNHEEFIKRGYPEELYRLWQFYFSYCEGGFLESSVGCIQLKLLNAQAKSKI